MRAKGGMENYNYSIALPRQRLNAAPEAQPSFKNHLRQVIAFGGKCRVNFRSIRLNEMAGHARRIQSHPTSIPCSSVQSRLVMAPITLPG